MTVDSTKEGRFETRSLPAFARCYPRSFTFYVANPIRSIPNRPNRGLTPAPFVRNHRYFTLSRCSSGPLSPLQPHADRATWLQRVANFAARTSVRLRSNNNEGRSALVRHRRRVRDVRHNERKELRRVPSRGWHPSQ